VAAAHTHEGGRRTCLLFEAGPARYAIEATRVVEVAPPDADRPAVRGVFPLEDLSVLMGGGPEQRPGLAVVLDSSPTRAVRVREGAEVADVSGDPHFQLTHDLGLRIGELVRGALFHHGRLYLELRPEAVGMQVALCATRVGGVETELVPDEGPGAWRTRSGLRALAPDVTRLLGASNLTAPRGRPSDASV